MKKALIHKSRICSAIHNASEPAREARLFPRGALRLLPRTGGGKRISGFRVGGCLLGVAEMDEFISTQPHFVPTRPRCY